MPEPIPGDPKTRLMPLKQSPPGIDDVDFLQAEDDEVKVRLQVAADGSLTILALSPNVKLAEKLLDNVPPDQVRTELCG